MLHDNEVEAGKPRPYFGSGRVATTAVPAPQVNSLSMTRDGQRLLAVVPQGGATAQQLVLVQHAGAAGH